MGWCGARASALESRLDPRLSLCGFRPLVLPAPRARNGRAAHARICPQNWLRQGSSLKISADEQVNFLHRLLCGRLPFSDRTVGILKEIMIVNKTDDAVLRGKTGMGGPDNARLNWFVGYVERGKRRYVFATNIEAANLTDPLTARHIKEQILHHLKLF